MPSDNNLVYSIKCPDCDSGYLGESLRRFGDRLHEHNSASFGGKMGVFYEHTLNTGHRVPKPDNCKILGRDKNMFRRRVRETILIDQRKPDLNGNSRSVELNLF